MTGVLLFRTPASIAAARHLLGSPPLCNSPWITAHAVVGGGMQVRVPAGVYSSGESDCLIPLLSSLSTEGAYFDLRSLWKLDEDTRMAAWQAIGIGAGCIESVMTP